MHHAISVSMNLLKDVWPTLIGAVVVLLSVAGVVIPFASDRYSAKQAIIASVVPPYAIYIAVTYPFAADDDAEASSENSPEASVESWEHLSKAVDHCNTANAIAEAATPADLDSVRSRVEMHFFEALREARMIDCAELERASVGLGDGVRMYLIPGLEKLVEGAGQADFASGRALVDQFGEAYNELWSEVHEADA